MIVIGLVLAIREHSWIRRAHVAPGAVVEIVTTGDSKDGKAFKPRVRFTAEDGSQHDFVRSYGSNPLGFSLGEQVLVAYDPRSHKGRILTFGQRFGPAVFMVAGGLTLILISSAFIFGNQLVPRIYLR
jgi:hypothetical protein